MPSCFQLTNKSTGLVATLQDVDVAICNHLECVVDPKYWCCDWYNTIGFLIATKTERSLGSQELRDEVATLVCYDPTKEYSEDDQHYQRTLNTILEFLEANYTSDSFYSYK